MSEKTFHTFSRIVLFYFVEKMGGCPWLYFTDKYAKIDLAKYLLWEYGW